MEISNPSQSEKSSSEKKIIRDAEEVLLSQEDRVLTYLDRGDLAQVFLGIRPATYLSVESFEEYDPDYASRWYKKDVSSVEKLLKKIGLPFYSNYNTDQTKFMIGHTLDEATRLKNAYTLSSPTESVRQFGLALGYPSTAVDAFVRFSQGEHHAAISIMDVPDVPEWEVRAFIGFRVSREYWRDEVAEIRRRAKILKENMPDLYSFIIQRG